MTKKVLLSVALTICLSSILAQSPAPIVIQAASPYASKPATSEPTSAAPDLALAQSAVKLLEEMKAKNAETLQKQEATLQQLDEIQQAAEQLKIYSKRG